MIFDLLHRVNNISMASAPCGGRFQVRDDIDQGGEFLIAVAAGGDHGVHEALASFPETMTGVQMVGSERRVPSRRKRRWCSHMAEKVGGLDAVAVDGRFAALARRRRDSDHSSEGVYPIGNVCTTLLGFRVHVVCGMVVPRGFSRKVIVSPHCQHVQEAGKIETFKG